MDETLRSRIIGQDEAVTAVSLAIEKARMRASDVQRPLGAFLFLGPTGVGKTELARALTESMFGSENAMLNQDMSDLPGESSLGYLIGLAPGHERSEEGGRLTEWVRYKPHSLIVFDEIEAASERIQIQRLLLQIVQEGRLIDGRGDTVDFSNTIIIVTTYIGGAQLAVPVLMNENKEAAMESVRAHFHPELLNRLDEIVMFNALSPEHLADIMRQMLRKEVRLLEEQRGIILTISEIAAQWLTDQNNQPEYGARPLNRIIRRMLREPLADFLIKSNPPAGTEIKIGMAAKKDGGLKFSAIINGQEIAIES